MPGKIRNGAEGDSVLISEDLPIRGREENERGWKGVITRTENG